MTWDVNEVRTMSGEVFTYERCNCDERLERVEAGGELVAWLCTDCDRQLTPRSRDSCE